MKNILRQWLGINEDAKAIAADVNTLHHQVTQQALHTFELFHTLPFAAGIMQLSAADAARLTAPNGIQANSLPAILSGVLLKARQGDSQLQVEGVLAPEVRIVLESRGFKVEEFEGTAGKSTYILWT